MESLLLHDQTRAQLRAMASDPPHALLLVGPLHIGKRTVAITWAKQITPHIEVLEPDDKDTISIQSVRELYRRTRSRHAKRQVILVDHAEAMGIDSQNAFLKLLEEPPSGVLFILTAPHTDALLPTITSRVQSVQLLPVASTHLADWLQATRKLAPQELAQLLFVAQGRPALARHLLEDPQEFTKHKTLMQRAKQLMGAPQYERLAMVSELIKDRASLVTTLEAMAHMTKLQIAKSPDARWLGLADGLQTCLSRLAQNGNPRAQVMRLLMLY